MKTLIIKTGRQVNIAPPDKRDFSEIIEDFKNGINLPCPQYIDEYIEIQVSEDTIKFIENVANVEIGFYGDKTYEINNIKFKIVDKTNS